MHAATGHRAPGPPDPGGLRVLAQRPKPGARYGHTRLGTTPTHLTGGRLGSAMLSAAHRAVMTRDRKD